MGYNIMGISLAHKIIRNLNPINPFKFDYNNSSL
jgi:hypothetical protein